MQHQSIFEIQRLSRCAPGERVCQLAGNAPVTIGTSEQCDLSLHLSFGLPDVCLQIRIEESLCVLEDLTGDPGLICVNGQSVVGISQLEDGDALQVGSDQFAVIESRSPADTATHRQAGLAALMGDDSVFGTQFVGHDVVVRLAQNPGMDDEILEQLGRHPKAFLLANFKYAQMDPPAGLELGEDLCETLPADYCGEDSLHVVREPDCDRMMRIAWQLQQRNAALWCIPSAGQPLAIRHIQNLLLWFLRPAFFQEQLIRNGNEFGSLLLQHLDAVIKPPTAPDSRMQVCYKPGCVF